MPPVGKRFDARCQKHLDAARSGDNVSIGDNVAIRIDNHTGAPATPPGEHGGCRGPGDRGKPGRDNLHDRRTHSLSQKLEPLTQFVEIGWGLSGRWLLSGGSPGAQKKGRYNECYSNANKFCQHHTHESTSKPRVLDDNMVIAEYRHGAHAVYDIQYHLIWITKYRPSFGAPGQRPPNCWRAGLPLEWYRFFCDAAA